MTSDADYFLVCSYPKSGRTWLRFGLFVYLKYLYRLSVPVDFEQCLMALPNWDKGTAEPWPPSQVTGLADVPPIRFHHFLPIEEVCKRLDLGEARGPRRLMIVRGPRQTLVSAYHHYRDFMMIWDGELDDFLALSPWGAQGYVAYYNAWAKTLNSEPASLMLTYGGMKSDFAASLRQTVITLGLPVDEDALAAAARGASIDNMQRLEARTGGFPGRARDAAEGNPNARRVRVGRARAPRLSLTQERLVDAALAGLSPEAVALLTRCDIDLGRD